MTTLTLNCCVKETALGNQDYFKIIIDTDKNGHDLKKLIWENIGILDINIHSSCRVDKWLFGLSEDLKCYFRCYLWKGKRS